MTNDNSTDKHNKITKEKADRFSPINSVSEIADSKRVGLVCPNCGANLEGRKCKLLCVRVGCGYQVTCSEW